MQEGQQQGLVNRPNFPNQGEIEDWRVTFPPELRFNNVFKLINAMCPLGPNYNPQSEACVFMYNYLRTIETGIFENSDSRDQYYELIKDKIRFFESRRRERMSPRRIFNAVSRSSFFTSDRLPVMAEGQQQGRWDGRKVLNEGATKEWQERYPPVLRLNTVIRILHALCLFGPNCDRQSEAYVFMKNYVKTIENGLFAMANDRLHYNHLIEDKIRFFESRRNERRTRRRRRS
ncbi:Hypothetical predicted protein [Cloeon dipterum]|uniref:KIX domain-containing protein n=1 Tax=Cloeon dipterum TaxID=197152 RepID=A0A8S1D2U1_9INSE|nr:Hypothetical predicted protein [Cloeon dipterum]